MFEMFHDYSLKNEEMCAAEGYDTDEFVLVMKKTEEWSSLHTSPRSKHKQVSKALLLVLFQCFPLSTGLYLSSCLLCGRVKSLVLCVDTCGHLSTCNTMRDYFSVVLLPPPLYLCISISSLFPSVSVSLSHCLASVLLLNWLRSA